MCLWQVDNKSAFSPFPVDVWWVKEGSTELLKMMKISLQNMHRNAAKYTCFLPVFLGSFIQNVCLQFFCSFENLGLCVVYDPQFDQTKVYIMQTSVRSPDFSVHCRFFGLVRVVKAVMCNHWLITQHFFWGKALIFCVSKCWINWSERVFLNSATFFQLGLKCRILWDGRHTVLNSFGDVRVLTSTQVSKEWNGRAPGYWENKSDRSSLVS